jgi:hypothetical protein
MARLTQNSIGTVPHKRLSNEGVPNPHGAAAAPVILQGRNSAASINSGYNESNVN